MHTFNLTPRSHLDVAASDEPFPFTAVAGVSFASSDMGPLSGAQMNIQEYRCGGNERAESHDLSVR